MKTRIHVNQHVIRKNRRDGENNPVLTAKTYKDNRYGHNVKISGPCEIIYRPENPLSCGAHVWVETNSKVIVT